MGSKRTGSSLESECAKRVRADPDGAMEEAARGVCSDDEEASRDPGGQGLGEGIAPAGGGDAPGETGGDAGEAQGGRRTDEAEGEEDAEADVCGICLEDTALAPQRGFLDACTHVFCFECILRWSEVESRCPMCKQRFTRLRRVPCGAAGASDVLSTRRQRSTTVQVPLRDQRFVPETMDAEAAALAAQDAYANTGCSECGGEENEHLLLLCDRCDGASHTYCVGLGTTVPRGSWLCRSCREQGERRRRAGGRLQEIRAQVRSTLTRAASWQQGRAPLGAGPSDGVESEEGILLRGGRTVAAGTRRAAVAGLEVAQEEEELEGETSDEEGGEGEDSEEEDSAAEDEDREEGEDGEGEASWDWGGVSGESSASEASEMDPEEHRALSSLLPRQHLPASSARVATRRRRKKRRKKKKGRRRKKVRSSAGRVSARASSSARASQPRRRRVTWGAPQQSLLAQLRETARTSLAARNAGTPRPRRAAATPRPSAAPALGSAAGAREEDPFALPLSQLQQATHSRGSTASGVRTVLSQRVAPSTTAQWHRTASVGSSGALTSPGAAAGSGQVSAGRATARLLHGVPARGEDPDVAASWRLAERVMGSLPPPPPPSLGRGPASTLGVQAADAHGAALPSRLAHASCSAAGSSAEGPRAPGRASGARLPRTSLRVPAVVAELDWGLPTQRPQAGPCMGGTPLQAGKGTGGTPLQAEGERPAPSAGPPRDPSPDCTSLAASRRTPPHEGEGRAAARQVAAVDPGQGLTQESQDERGESSGLGLRAPSLGQEPAEPDPLPGLSAQLASVRAENRRRWEAQQSEHAHSHARPSHAHSHARPARRATASQPHSPRAQPECRKGQDRLPHGSLDGAAATPGTRGNDPSLGCRRGEPWSPPPPGRPLQQTPAPGSPSPPSRPQQQAPGPGTAAGSGVTKGRQESSCASAERPHETASCSTLPGTVHAPAPSPSLPGPRPPASPAAGQPPGAPPAEGGQGWDARKKHKELVAAAVKDRLHALYRKGQISRDDFREIARQATHDFLRELHQSSGGGCDVSGTTGLEMCVRRTRQCTLTQVASAMPGHVCSDCVERLVAERMANRVDR